MITIHVGISTKVISTVTRKIDDDKKKKESIAKTMTGIMKKDMLPSLSVCQLLINGADGDSSLPVQQFQEYLKNKQSGLL